MYVYKSKVRRTCNNFGFVILCLRSNSAPRVIILLFVASSFLSCGAHTSYFCLFLFFSKSTSHVWYFYNLWSRQVGNPRLHVWPHVHTFLGWVCKVQDHFFEYVFDNFWGGLDFQGFIFFDIFCTLQRLLILQHVAAKIIIIMSLAFCCLCLNEFVLDCIRRKSLCFVCWNLLDKPCMLQAF